MEEKIKKRELHKQVHVGNKNLYNIYYFSYELLLKEFMNKIKLKKAFS